MGENTHILENLWTMLGLKKMFFQQSRKLVAKGLVGEDRGNRERLVKGTNFQLEDE